MKTLRFNNKILIFDGRDPLKYIDLTDNRVYQYPGIYIDEASNFPVFKWWRNPVKWYRLRKLIRISSKNTKVVLQTTPRDKQ